MACSRTAIAWSVALLCAAAPAPADEESEMTARVRVHFAGRDREPLVGNVTAVDEDSLTLNSGTTRSWVVPLRDVSRLERSVRPGRRARGAKIGLLTGFALGFTMIVAQGNGPDSSGLYACLNYYPCKSGEIFLVGALVGLVLGAPGALIGAVVGPGEKWETVPVYPASLAGPPPPAATARPPTVQPPAVQPPAVQPPAVQSPTKEQPTTQQPVSAAAESEAPAVAPSYGRPLGIGAGVIFPSHRSATAWGNLSWRLRAGDDLVIEPDVGFWFREPDRWDATSNSLALGANVIFTRGTDGPWAGAALGVHVVRYGATVAPSPFYRAYPAMGVLAGYDRRVSRRLTAYVAVRGDLGLWDWDANGIKAYAGIRLHR